MAFEKQYPNRKDHRKQYQGVTSMRSDRTCRPGGSCPYCRHNRLFSTRKRETESLEKLKQRGDE